MTIARKVPGILRFSAGILFLAVGCAHTPSRSIEVPGKVAPSSPTEKIEPRIDRVCAPIRKTIESCLGDEYDVELKDQLVELARCESGCRPNAKSPAGYLGLFQFGARSWKALCRPVFRRSSRPECEATHARVDPCCAALCTAETLQAGGHRHWPNCGTR